MFSHTRFQLVHLLFNFSFAYLNGSTKSHRGCELKAEFTLSWTSTVYKNIHSTVVLATKLSYSKLRPQRQGPTVNHMLSKRSVACILPMMGSEKLPRRVNFKLGEPQFRKPYHQTCSVSNLKVPTASISQLIRTASMVSGVKGNFAPGHRYQTIQGC